MCMIPEQIEIENIGYLTWINGRADTPAIRIFDELAITNFSKMTSEIFTIFIS